MCMIILFLSLHIIGAGILGLFVIAAISTLITKKARYYKFLAISVAVNTVVQLVSGVLLAVTSSEGMSVLTVCTRIGAYLLLLFVIEAALIVAMRNVKHNVRTTTSHSHAITKPETGQVYLPNV